MNDNQVFEGFLQNICGLGVPRARTEVLGLADTFAALLSTTDDEIDAFVKSTHSANSARNNNSKILIPVATVLSLKAILFELKDREKCNALPNHATLQGLNVQQVTLMRAQRTLAISEADRELRLPQMEVPKLTASNYEEFYTSFKSVASRTIGHNRIPLDYLMRGENGTYEQAWPTRLDKLKNCIVLSGPTFKEDNAALYSLFVQYIGTSGIGSNTVKKYAASRNGRQCHIDLRSHFRNDSYLENKATNATATIQQAHYRGDRRQFTLESYYTIMTTAFNDLEIAGPNHALSEAKKVAAFEYGLKEKDSISWSITAKSEWNKLPIADQNFESYYNEFSKYMTKLRTLTSSDSRHSRISNLNSDSGDRGGRGGGRGRGRGGRGRGGRGRGRGGRGGRGNRYSPYSMTRSYGGQSNFNPKAKNYERHEWESLSSYQKTQVQELKAQQGWINGYTPPPGFNLDDNGFAVPSNTMVAAVRHHIGITETSMNNSNGTMVPLPPPPIREAPVPPIIETNPNQAGMSFGRSGTRNRSQDDHSAISAVSINGRNYNGHVYDSRGNRLS